MNFDKPIQGLLYCFPSTTVWAFFMNKSCKIFSYASFAIKNLNKISDHLSIIKQMSQKHGFNVLIEKVDESGKIGIVVENGEIKKNNYVDKSVIFPY